MRLIAVLAGVCILRCHGSFPQSTSPSAGSPAPVAATSPATGSPTRISTTSPAAGSPTRVSTTSPAAGSASALPAIPPPSTATPPVAKASPAAPSCDGADHRIYGSTCCAVNRTEDKVPGMVFLSCTGPQIGKACRAKGDCDVVCSCDPPDAYLGGGTPPRGPADGTRGAVGRCGGRLQVGTWMCEIDEHGTVGHVIVD